MDVRLGCIYDWDTRNSNFAIKDILPRVAYQSNKPKIWNCKKVLDQGQQPACVGFAFAHHLIAEPYAEKHIGNPEAQGIYKRAQFLDNFPGENYSGTSTGGGVKALQQLYPNSIDSYRWGDTKSLDDILATLEFFPLVISTNWLYNMFYPDKSGLVKPGGAIVGNHAYLIRGKKPKKKLLVFQNSWGKTFGQNGTFYMSYDDVLQLMQVQSTLCLPLAMGWWHK